LLSRSISSSRPGRTQLRPSGHFQSGMGVRLNLKFRSYLDLDAQRFPLRNLHSICPVMPAGSNGRCNTVLICFSVSVFQKNLTFERTRLDLTRAVFFLSQRSRTNLAIGTPAARTSGECCVDPLKPPLLIGQVKF